MTQMQIDELQIMLKSGQVEEAWKLVNETQIRPGDTVTATSMSPALLCWEEGGPCFETLTPWAWLIPPLRAHQS